MAISVFTFLCFRYIICIVKLNREYIKHGNRNRAKCCCWRGAS
nr:MAG TPA: hypothetical protein [Caudoviricetes sp.]